MNETIKDPWDGPIHPSQLQRFDFLSYVNDSQVVSQAMHFYSPTHFTQGPNSWIKFKEADFVKGEKKNIENNAIV